MAKLEKDLPIVYSCSGCSSAAQMANFLALKLNESGSAQMSCIAGIGGGVAPIIKLAKSGRPIIAIDGCPLNCSLECLKKIDCQASLEINMSKFGVRKINGEEFDRAQAENILSTISEQVTNLHLQ